MRTFLDNFREVEEREEKRQQLVQAFENLINSGPYTVDDLASAALEVCFPYRYADESAETR